MSNGSLNVTKMMRWTSQIIFVMLAAISGSCAHQSADSLRSSPKKQFASTQRALPENGGSPSAVRRLTGWRWLLTGLQHQYILKEGPAHRGANFAKLVNALRTVARSEPPVTEVEVIELLGWPDYEKFDRYGGAYAYIYSNRLPEDSIAGVQVNASGTIILVDTFKRDVADLHLFHQYAPWPEGKFPGLEEGDHPIPGSRKTTEKVPSTTAASG
jgi:hypothetical protein